MSNLQEKKLKTRVSHKHNFEIAWNEAHEHDFVPLAAEWIVYDREVDKQGNLLTELPEGRTEPYAYERFKIGNGIDKVGDLDFINIGKNGGETAATNIVDVIALPTGNIDTSVTYRLLNGTFVLNRMLGHNSTCHLVEWDSVPDEPLDPVFAEDEASGGLGMRITGYYNILDNTVYGCFDSDSIQTISDYIDYLVTAELLNSVTAAALKLALSGMTPGWKTMEQILSLVGPAMSIRWGGIITAIDESVDPEILYLYLTSNLFFYRDGKWVGLNSGVGMPGTGLGAEIFNSPDNLAYGAAAHAEGRGNMAEGDYSHAEGYSNGALGKAAHAEGDDNSASGDNSHAEGERNTASGKNAHAEGCITNATGDHSHTEGYKTTASASAAHAGGIGTIASGEGQMAIGRYNQEDVNKAFIIGNGGVSQLPGVNGSAVITNEIRQNAMTVDWDGNAVFAGDVTSRGQKLTTESYVNTKVSDVVTDITNIKSTYATKAYVDDSYTTAGKKAETVLGIKSTAEGFDNTVTGSYSHAEGWNNTVKSNFSHAEGVNVYIEEGADAAHGEGIDIVVEGLYSHAEGYMTSVFGAMAHGEGVGNTVYGDAQHVQGKFNVEDEDGKYQHIVGNGDSDESRSNAHTIDWSGNAWFSGDIKIGGTGYDDENAKTLATQEFVLNAIREYVNEALLNGRW